MPTTAELYAQYEASLAALQDVPDQVTRGLDAARRSEETAQKAADAAFQQNSTRLAGLRRTTQSRYESSAAVLKEHDIRLPPQVRPEADVPGDEMSLKREIDAQARAAAAVDAGLKGALADAQRAQADAARRAQGAQQAAEALRARQEKVRRDREVAAAAQAAAEQASVRRRRLMFGLIGGGAAVLIVAVIVILVSINQ